MGSGQKGKLVDLWGVRLVVFGISDWILYIYIYHYRYIYIFCGYPRLTSSDHKKKHKKNTTKSIISITKMHFFVQIFVLLFVFFFFCAFLCVFVCVFLCFFFGAFVCVFFCAFVCVFFCACFCAFVCVFCDILCVCFFLRSSVGEMLPVFLPTAEGFRISLFFLCFGLCFFLWSKTKGAF